MTYADYASRVNVHPDRYGERKTQGPNLWAVLHTSEGGESSTAAEGLASYLTRPGDRPNDSGGVYGSSYHVIFDTDRVIPCVPYDVVAYSAGGGNAQGVHGCFPGRAGQTRAQWLDSVTRPMIRQAAAWLLDVEAQLQIPVKLITSIQMRAYQRGFCDHNTVSQAFRKSTHTDVGPNFPWDVLMTDVAQIRGESSQPVTDEGASVLTNIIRFEGTNAVYAQYSGGYKTWLFDEPTRDVMIWLSGKNVQVIERKYAALFRATGPILGPIPAGVDAWGIPF